MQVSLFILQLLALPVSVPWMKWRGTYYPIRNEWDSWDAATWMGVKRK